MSASVIQRNFLRLLRAGLFGTTEPAEPMSAWKWERLWSLAMLHGVAVEVLRGIDAGAGDFFLQLPPSQTAKWRQTAAGLTRPADQPEMKTFTAEMLAGRLRTIVASSTEDGHVSPTLRLLLLIVSTSRHLMTDGICLRGLSDMALLLRDKDAEIDSKELKRWLARVQMKYMAHLEGSLLVAMLGLQEAEVPILRGKPDSTNRGIGRDIFTLQTKNTGEWHFTEQGRVFVATSNRRAMMWHLRHGATFLKYCPIEAISCLTKSMIDSLGQIEE